MQELDLISIDKILINPNQPRRVFNEEELMELSSSIKQNGLLQPPLVRPIEDGFFELVAGERRFRACKLAGLQAIPVIIEERTYLESAKAALIENIQRVDLNPIETAMAIRSLMNQFALSQEEVAEKVAKKRSTVANFLRLLNLPKVIQDDIMNGKLSMGLAKVILSVEESSLQLFLHEHIVEKNLTVREAEKLIEKMQSKKGKPLLQTRNFLIEELEESLRKELGTKIEIVEKSKKSGYIKIDYYDLDAFDKIFSRLTNRSSDTE